MTKQAVINRLSSIRKHIIDLIEPLPQQEWRRVWLGKWTLLDFVAHLVGWDVWGKKATQEILAGTLPSYYRFEEKNWVAFNDKLVSTYRKRTKKAALDAVRRSHAALREELERVSEDDMNRDFGIRHKRKIITVASDTLYQADDEVEHAKQLERWIQTGQPQ